MICTHVAQHIGHNVVGQPPFLDDFCLNFWQFLKKCPAVLRTGWPDILQTVGASRVISKEYPTIILDVGETSKRFNVNSRIFFYSDFFTNFFPVGKPSQNDGKFWLDLQRDFVFISKREIQDFNFVQISNLCKAINFCRGETLTI